MADEHTVARRRAVQTENPRFASIGQVRSIRQVRSPVPVGAGRPEYRRTPARHEDAATMLTAC
jgi:hypothetical protein